MLSGCDYLDSIPGIGIKTAHRLLRKHKTVEKVCWIYLNAPLTSQLLMNLRLEGAYVVPPDYLVKFAQAELVFLHQRVFDQKLNCLRPLNNFPSGGISAEEEKWVGL